MKNLIGTATIHYNSKEKVETVNFTSANLIKDSSGIIEKHVVVFDSVKEEKNMDKAADNVLALLFSKLTEVELRDMETTVITHEVNCLKVNNKIVKCVIKYYLEDK